MIVSKLLSKIFPIVRKIERDITNVLSYSRQVLMNLEFSQQIFQKYSDIKCHDNPSSNVRAQLFHADGQTHRQMK